MKKLILLLLSILFILTSCGNANNPNIVTYEVLTESMTWESDYPKEFDFYEIGEIRSRDKVELDTSISFSDYKIGDVITFKFIIGGYDSINTSRIVNIVKDSNDKYMFVTQSDKNHILYGYDKNASDSDKYIQESSGIILNVKEEDIIGKVIKVIHNKGN